MKKNPSKLSKLMVSGIVSGVLISQMIHATEKDSAKEKPAKKMSLLELAAATDGNITDHLMTEDELLIQPGEVIALGPHEIHSVKNMTDDIGVSIHIYGMNLNYTGRSQFDPTEHLERPYLIEFK